MPDKLIITRRGAPRTLGTASLEAAAASGRGLNVEHELQAGSLIGGEVDEQSVEALRAQGYRVKRLRDVNLLRIHEHEIDTSVRDAARGELEIASRLRLPQQGRPDWIHHLAQLDGPPQPAWIDEIEARGATVLESLPPYGLLLHAEASDMPRVADLPFVAWTGPMLPAYRIHPSLNGRRGAIRHVRVVVYPPERLGEVARAITEAPIEGTVEAQREPEPMDAPGYAELTVEITAGQLWRVSRLPPVRLLEFQPPRLMIEDERTAQILAERTDGAPPPGTRPVTGYSAVLAELGLDGSGVTIGIADTGVDNHDSATLHPDLRNRLAFFLDQSNGGETADGGFSGAGHGTHVAGIAAGNGGSGDTDPQGFALGQGVAPGASIGSANILTPGAPWPPPVGTHVQAMAAAGADVMNNSWWDGTGVGAGYTANSRILDQRARDPDTTAPGLQAMTLVFSAGNSGGGASTITSPKEAKNIVVVGNSLTARPGERFASDDIRALAGSSSRGPARDGRLMPTVVAPGTDVVSARSTADHVPNQSGVQRPRSAYRDTASSLHEDHTAMSGTSMAAPQVSGLAALLIQWWRARTDRTPSPAMIKALLVNGAEDMAGGENWRRLATATWSPGPNGSSQVVGLGFTPNRLVESGSRVMNEVAGAAQVTQPGQWAYTAATDTLTFRRFAGGSVDARDSLPLAAVPNHDQGWGRVSLANTVLQAPDSDRGPRLFHDQRHAFTATGQEFLLRVSAADPSRPLRITLAWTDAPAAAGANPALMNDLDLEVLAEGSGELWVGNQFADGFSTPGGDFDDRNTVECVYVEQPVAGETYGVSVIAANLVANARPPWDLAPWQDFALVVDNAVEPAATPIAVAALVDRSASMEWSGSVDAARAANRGFLAQLGTGDAVALASFASSAQQAYPPAPALRAAAIDSAAKRDAAMAAVAGIDFGGGTAMGPGISAARDLLAPVPVPAGRKSMVLLSDGFDGGSPGALAAAATLPPGLRIYPCALGPAADADLLEQLAGLSGGALYFAPEADDLLEIYNHIRSRISGEGLVVNQTSTAGTSAIGAFVDAQSEAATFSVAWTDPTIRFVTGAPSTADEIRVRLVAPGERRIHPGDAGLRRTVGPGCVVFRVEEPPAGAWRVEVETGAGGHTRYTVGAFVRSPLRLLLDLQPRRPRTGAPLAVSARVFEGNTPVNDVRAVARFTRPREGLAAVQARLAAAMANATVPPALVGDGMADDLARLLVVRREIVAAGGVDPLRRRARRRALREVRGAQGGGVAGGTGVTGGGGASAGGAGNHGGSSGGGGGSAGGGIGIVGGGGGTLGLGVTVGVPLGGPTAPAGAAAGVSTAGGRVLGASFSSTAHPGVYAVRVDAAGVSEHSGARFSRVGLIATVVGA